MDLVLPSRMRRRTATSICVGKVGNLQSARSIKPVASTYKQATELHADAKATIWRGEKFLENYVGSLNCDQFSTSMLFCHFSAASMMHAHLGVLVACQKNFMNTLLQGRSAFP